MYKKKSVFTRSVSVEKITTERLKPLEPNAKAIFVAWSPADEGRHCHGLPRIYSPDPILHQPWWKLAEVLTKSKDF